MSEFKGSLTRVEFRVRDLEAGVDRLEAGVNQLERVERLEVKMREKRQLSDDDLPTRER
jgi:hypothetical protein